MPRLGPNVNLRRSPAEANKEGLKVGKELAEGRGSHGLQHKGTRLSHTQRAQQCVAQGRSNAEAVLTNHSQPSEHESPSASFNRPGLKQPLDPLDASAALVIEWQIMTTAGHPV
jgi:hypothetical protein